MSGTLAVATFTYLRLALHFAVSSFIVANAAWTMDDALEIYTSVHYAHVYSHASCPLHTIVKIANFVTVISISTVASCSPG